MKITREGDIELVTFWPADEVQKAFKEVQNIIGKPDELERLRRFYRAMNFFHKISSTSGGSVSPDEIARLYEYAKKEGVDMEGKKI